MAEKARIIKVDFTGVETGGGRVHIPEGDYGLKLSKVLTKKGEDSGKPYLDATFTVVKGNQKGIKKELRHSFTLQKQGLFNLRNFLEAAGMKVPSKLVSLDLNKMIGREAAASVIDDEYEGRKKSVIGAFFPMEDLDKTSEEGDEIEEEPTEEEGGEETTDETEELFS